MSDARGHGGRTETRTGHPADHDQPWRARFRSSPDRRVRRSPDLRGVPGGDRSGDLGGRRTRGGPARAVLRPDGDRTCRWAGSPVRDAGRRPADRPVGAARAQCRRRFGHRAARRDRLRARPGARGGRAGLPRGASRFDRGQRVRPRRRNRVELPCLGAGLRRAGGHRGGDRRGRHDPLRRARTRRPAVGSSPRSPPYASACTTCRRRS
jgi:hypothetical protein